MVTASGRRSQPRSLAVRWMVKGESKFLKKEARSEPAVRTMYDGGAGNHYPLWFVVNAYVKTFASVSWLAPALYSTRLWKKQQAPDSVDYNVTRMKSTDALVGLSSVPLTIPPHTSYRVSVLYSNYI